MQSPRRRLSIVHLLDLLENDVPVSILDQKQPRVLVPAPAEHDIFRDGDLILPAVVDYLDHSSTKLIFFLYYISTII